MTKRSARYMLRSSLWLIPLLALVTGFVAALLLVQLDMRVDAQLRRLLPGFLQPGPEGARQALATIGSSMITVAGVVFSITIVALSLTANQYSPRVLRNFMRDRLNQTVLGVFVGVFVYSLLVLQATGSTRESFVPLLALWVAVAMVIVSIGFLIAFIHHTATSIQVSEILARITAETVEAFEAVRKTSAEGRSSSVGCDDLQHLDWRTVPSHASGYVQDIDLEKLFQLACGQQLVVRVECPVGDFTVAGRPLVSVSGTDDISPKLIAGINRLFGVSSYRTIEQDPAFGVRQIVDIALRALSPGISDATTAINCVDYLGVVLHHSLNIQLLPEVRAEGANPRLVLRHLQPEHLLDVALNEVRHSASNNLAVLLRLLRVLRQLRETVAAPGVRAHLRYHTQLIADDAERCLLSAADKAEIVRAADRALAAKYSAS